LREHIRCSFCLQWSRSAHYGRFVNPSSPPALAAYRRASRFWRGYAFSHRPFGAVYLGCETRTVPAEYRWDGMRRGADPRHPQVMFQATLAGAGAFERGGQRWTVGPETAFLAILPSRHLYYLPEANPEWSFFWFTFGHPYVVSRLAELAERHPPVFALPNSSPLAAQCLAIFEHICHGRFEDDFAEEGALLEWMLGVERHLHDLAHPRDRRDAMLREVRQFTENNLARSFGIEEIAGRHNLSRSHFSHRFRQATGLAAAAYVLELRLAEVRRSLRETAAPLKEIAAATGFADANHLCKVFRRQYHLSPGTYRRQAT
jgi:AraC-like DNA-binding protein